MAGSVGAYIKVHSTTSNVHVKKTTIKSVTIGTYSKPENNPKSSKIILIVPFTHLFTQII